MRSSWLGWLCITMGVLIPYSFHGTSADIDDLEAEVKWVNTTYNAMNLDQRIGQLFMVRAFSKGDPAEEAKVQSLIRDHHIGGMCFFQGNPKKQVELTNRYQSMSRLPMLISIDAEWGLGMRFKDRAISFPRQLTMGAVRNNKVIYDFGVEVGRQLKRMGIHINFAPVIDINNNPQNPVINNRSFGEDRNAVTAKGYAYMKGLQDQGVIACAKHFPGHGDTDVDSHHDLPIIPHSEKRLDSLELYPFKILSQMGVRSMMIAHLQVPALDSSRTTTTLSYPVVSEKLKKEIGFQGLVITDALDMKGVANYVEPGELEVRAFQAGNDILLLSEDVPKAKSAIKKALADGRIPEWRVEESVKKILASKYRLGLTTFKNLNVDKVYDDIITSGALSIKGRVYEHALTCIDDPNRLLPLGQKEVGKKIGVLSVGTGVKTVFQKRVQAYAHADLLTCSNQAPTGRLKSIQKSLKDKDIVIIGLHDYSKRPKNNHGLSTGLINMINELSSSTMVIVVAFGSPYVWKVIKGKVTAIQAFENDEIAQDFCAQALFGVFKISGMMPVTPSPEIVVGQGKIIKSNGRLGYVIPEVVGLNSDTLDKMVSLVEKMMETKAAPGCQILVARKGKVVYHEAFGYHDYNKGRKVQLNDVYDVASITKVAATTLAVMKLVDEGKVNLDASIRDYFPELDTSNKADLKIRDILAHHALLPGWIPFYESTQNSRKRLKGEWYRKKEEIEYSIPVAKELYLRNDFPDTILARIAACSLRTNPGYRYSDLGFYLFDRMVKKLTDQRLDVYCENTFYKPMGLRHITFNPLQNGVPLGLIPPTEEDSYFRNQRIQGYVHDMGAAMQGGVAGHAGLFSNAHDLATLFQMLLEGGEYAGQKYIQPSTIDRFTQRHTQSTRRGLGFDMKELNPDKTENMSELASSSAFGHLGFTGTCAWADPEEDLIFIFLSNRTYPSMRNNKLHRENYRPKLQSIAYKALMKEE